MTKTKSKFDPTLTPTQHVMNSRKRKVSYNPDVNKNYIDPDVAKNILILYLLGFGYSPIRHLIGEKNDKKVEDVVRQHMIGRTKTSELHIEFDGEDFPFYGELYCPSKRKLTEDMVFYANLVGHSYNTLSDEYVVEMFKTGEWHDDPVNPRTKKCKNCGEELESHHNFCPVCGTPVKATATN